MYVRFDKERRGMDKVQRVDISLDDGSRITASIKKTGELVLTLRYGASSVARTGTLTEWIDSCQR